MRFQSLAFLFLISALTADSSRVHAQAADPSAGELEARRLFVQGREAYERELYTEAEDAFLAAYAAMPESDPRRPLILLNVAQAIERQGGRDEDALDAWRRFEREAQGAADPATLERAADRIRELEARVSRRRQETSAQARPTAAEPSHAGRRSPHPAGIALAAAGGGMVVVGGIVGIVGLVQRSSLLDRCEGTVCPEDARGDARRLEKLALSADLLLWPGLAVAATGAVLIFTLDRRDDEAPRLTAGCGLGGCSVGGRF